MFQISKIVYNSVECHQDRNLPFLSPYVSIIANLKGMKTLFQSNRVLDFLNDMDRLHL